MRAYLCVSMREIKDSLFAQENFHMMVSLKPEHLGAMENYHMLVELACKKTDEFAMTVMSVFTIVTSNPYHLIYAYYKFLLMNVSMPGPMFEARHDIDCHPCAARRSFFPILLGVGFLTYTLPSFRGPLPLGSLDVLINQSNAE